MSETKKLDEILSIPNRADIEQYAKLSYRERRQIIIDIENEIAGNLNEQDGHNCDLCKNRGYTWKLNEDDMDTRVECKCMGVRETLWRAKRSGLGNILRDFTFKKFIVTDDWQRQNKEKAQAFCKDDSAKWFFIGGQVGSGKTHLCTAIAGHYIKAGMNVRYMQWSEESKKLKALINEYAEYQDVIKPYKNVEVLYIDDFLKTKAGEQPTQGDINLAFEILNHRLLDNEKITIISSEKTLSELLSYDEATMSRIYQKSGNYKIIVDKDISKNYRLNESF